MRHGFFTELSCVTCLAAVILPTALPAADLRDCRIDALTFTDPWSGEDFVVRSAGIDERLLCDGALVPAFAADDPAACRGPYRYVFLFGSFTTLSPFGEDPTAPHDALAVWSVLPAAPCCGWELVPASAFPADHWQGAVIFTPGNAPTLAEVGFGAIESDFGVLADMPPLLPIACGHGLE